MKYELVLRDEKGNKKLYEEEFVSGHVFLAALKIQSDEVADELEEMERLLEHTTQIFSDLKRDEILTGLEASELRTTLLELFYKTLGWGEKKRLKAIEYIRDEFESEKEKNEK